MIYPWYIRDISVIWALSSECSSDIQFAHKEVFQANIGQISRGSDADRNFKVNIIV